MTTLERWRVWDHTLTEKAAELVRSKITRTIATLLAHSGDSPLWLFGGVMLWRFTLGFWAAIGERIVLITGLTWVVATVLKYLFQRPRPDGEQGLFYLDLDQHSFPSGHATRVGGLLAILGPILPLWAIAGLIVWGTGVCVSRVALGLHYAGDVIAGVVVGGISGIVLGMVL